jgi:FAD:protein FMN transferase
MSDVVRYEHGVGAVGGTSAACGVDVPASGEEGSADGASGEHLAFRDQTFARAPGRRHARTTALEGHTFTAFGGSQCSILACDATPDELSACVAEVYAFEARLTRFRADSELSRFNAAAGRRVTVSPLLAELLRTALDAYALTDGLVNAAVLPALVAAGYDRTIEEVRRRRPVSRVCLGADAPCGGSTPRPSFAAGVRPNDSLPPAPQLPDVLHVGHTWARLAPDCAIDLGGVGKGWLADRLAERLENAAVNLGGDVAVRGDGPDGMGWSVGLCDGWAVALRQGGVATSGTEGRRWAGGHHLIDPRTGVPAATDLAAVGVVAGTAAQAEALSKAAVLLGSTDAAEWLQQHGATYWALQLRSTLS